jgi:glycerophosphoryl diester phosphodiesterase
MINLDTDRVKYSSATKGGSRIKIYAHAGIAARHPSNTLAAFREALEIDCDGIELDIHCSSEGVPVTTHDETLERLTNGHSRVVDHSVAELAALDVGNGEGVPTLEEVFALVGGKRHFDLEIKARNCEHAVLDLLARYPEVRAAISSFDWEVLANIRALAPDLELWVLTSAVSDEAIAAGKSVGATMLAVHYPALSVTSMAKAKDAGFEVMAWTANSKEEADRLRKLGVAALCTDDPDAVR